MAEIMETCQASPEQSFVSSGRANSVGVVKEASRLSRALEEADVSEVVVDSGAVDCTIDLTTDCGTDATSEIVDSGAAVFSDDLTLLDDIVVSKVMDSVHGIPQHDIGVMGLDNRGEVTAARSSGSHQSRTDVNCSHEVECDSAVISLLKHPRDPDNRLSLFDELAQVVGEDTEVFHENEEAGGRVSKGSSTPGDTGSCGSDLEEDLKIEARHKMRHSLSEQSEIELKTYQVFAPQKCKVGKDSPVSDSSDVVEMDVSFSSSDDSKQQPLPAHSGHGSVQSDNTDELLEAASRELLMTSTNSYFIELDPSSTLASDAGHAQDLKINGEVNSAISDIVLGHLDLNLNPMDRRHRSSDCKFDPDRTLTGESDQDDARSEPCSMQDSDHTSTRRNSNLSLVSSVSGDELFQLLDKIGTQGQEMKAQLEVAYYKQKVLQKDFDVDGDHVWILVDHLGRELDLLKTEKIHMTQNLTSAETSNAGYQMRIQEVETIVEGLNTQAEGLESQIKDYVDKLSLAEKQKKAVCHSLCTSQNKNEEYQDRIRDLEKEVFKMDDLESQVVQYKREEANHRKDIKNITEVLNAVKSENQDYLIKFKNLEKHVEIFSYEIGEYKGTEKFLLEEKRGLLEKHNYLEESLAQKEEEKHRSEEQVRIQACQIRDLGRQISEGKIREQALTEEIDALTVEMCAVKVEGEGMRRTSREQEEVIESRQRFVLELERKISKATKELDRIRISKEYIDKQLRIAEAGARAKGEEAKDLHNFSDELNVRIGELESEVSRQMTRNEGLVSEKEGLLAELTSARSLNQQMDYKAQSLGELIEKLHNQIKQLELQHAESRTNEQSLTAANSKLSEECTQLTRIIEQSRPKIDKLGDHIKNVQDHMGEMELQVEKEQQDRPQQLERGNPTRTRLHALANHKNPPDNGAAGMDGTGKTLCYSATCLGANGTITQASTSSTHSCYSPACPRSIMVSETSYSLYSAGSSSSKGEQEDCGRGALNYHCYSPACITMMTTTQGARPCYSPACHSLKTELRKIPQRSSGTIRMQKGDPDGTALSIAPGNMLTDKQHREQNKRDQVKVKQLEDLLTSLHEHVAELEQRIIDQQLKEGQRTSSGRLQVCYSTACKADHAHLEGYHSCYSPSCDVTAARVSVACQCEMDAVSLNYLGSTKGDLMMRKTPMEHLHSPDDDRKWILTDRDTISDTDSEREGLTRAARVAKLEQSLADATEECEDLQQKIETASSEMKVKVNKLKDRLAEKASALRKVQEQNEVLRVRNEGDQAEMSIMKERIAALNQDLSVKDKEIVKMNRDLNEARGMHSATAGEVEHSCVGQEEAVSSEHTGETSQEKLSEVKEEKNKLEQDLNWLQHDHNRSLEAMGDLEKSLSCMESERNLLQAEVMVLRDEYGYLRKGMEISEKLVDLKVPRTTVSSGHQGAAEYARPVELLAATGSAKPSEMDLEELKRHVYGWHRFKEARTGVTAGGQGRAGVMGSQGNKVETLHDNIMKQSELVLSSLKKGGDNKEDAVQSTVFHWQDVKDSIATQLMSESNSKILDCPQSLESTAAKSESLPANRSPGGHPMPIGQVDYSRLNGLERGSNLAASGEQTSSEAYSSFVGLAKAAGKEFGDEVEVVLDPRHSNAITLQLKPSQHPNISQRDDETKATTSSHPGKYQVDIDRINAEYETLRKQRLALFVQAYTGKPIPEKVIAETKAPEKMDEAGPSKVASMQPEPEPRPAASPTYSDSRESTAATIARLESKLAAMKQAGANVSSARLSNTGASHKEEDAVNVCQPDRPVLVTQVERDEESKRRLWVSLNEMDHGTQVRKPKAEDATYVNSTISAISRDSQLMKDRLRNMREQLAQAERKRGKSYFADKDLNALFPEDHADAKKNKDSEHQKSTDRKDSKSTVTSAALLSEAPKREVYPHKRGYESRAVVHRKRQQNASESRESSQRGDDLSNQAFDGDDGQEYSGRSVAEIYKPGVELSTSMLEMAEYAKEKEVPGKTFSAMKKYTSQLRTKYGGQDTKLNNSYSEATSRDANGYHAHTPKERLHTSYHGEELLPVTDDAYEEDCYLDLPRGQPQGHQSKARHSNGSEDNRQYESRHQEGSRATRDHSGASSHIESISKIDDLCHSLDDTQSVRSQSKSLAYRELERVVQEIDLNQAHGDPHMLRSSMKREHTFSDRSHYREDDTGISVTDHNGESSLRAPRPPRIQANVDSQAHDTHSVDSVPGSKESVKRKVSQDSTSESEFVVTRQGDILKRPKSPKSILKMPGSPGQKQNQARSVTYDEHTEAPEKRLHRSRENASEDSHRGGPEGNHEAEVYPGKRDDGGHGNAGIAHDDPEKWAEPKRHFGLPLPEEGQVHWHELEDSSTPHQQTFTHQIDHHTHQTRSRPLSPSQCELTDDQRRYADQIINRYSQASGTDRQVVPPGEEKHTHSLEDPSGGHAEDRRPMVPSGDCTKRERLEQPPPVARSGNQEFVQISREPSPEGGGSISSGVNKRNHQRTGDHHERSSQYHSQDLASDTPHEAAGPAMVSPSMSSISRNTQVKSPTSFAEEMPPEERKRYVEELIRKYTQESEGSENKINLPNGSCTTVPEKTSGETLHKQNTDADQAVKPMEINVVTDRVSGPEQTSKCDADGASVKKCASNGDLDPCPVNASPANDKKPPPPPVNVEDIIKKYSKVNEQALPGQQVNEALTLC